MIEQTPISLDSRDLLIIHALVQGGTLEAASRLLSRDVSSVFRAIKRIEKRYGLVLFNRSREGYSPLPVAQSLAQHGARIHDAISAGNQCLQTDDEALRGSLKITSTDFLVQYFLLPCINKFCAQHPNVSVEFDSRNESAQLWERDIDLALRPTNQPPSAMIGHRLGHLNYCVAGTSAGGGFGKDVNESVGAETQRPWLVPSGAISRHWSRRWVEDNKPSDAVCLGFDSMAALVNAVRSGCGIGVLPLLDNVVKGTTVLPQYLITETTQLWLLYHPNNTRNPMVRAFVEVVIDYAHRHLAEVVVDVPVPAIADQ
ncbi:HTH-type transcriptional regulator CynR [BD1-7 clade bacterium]|uniref:HTH-type transcriptional regulator CynR n=1 Tax=BD1-7 clade bacterium TaxID=2029982 RepID=A0A5S9PAX1_9GAMM|nr:HTH-type transcriptional regulator CynR [BD1-7 clade bacterium]